MNSETRNSNIDILKALGIIFMVAGHCRAPLPDFIFLFHMAIFFVASGYCYKSEKSDNIRNVIRFTKRKIKTLWLPYFIWTSLFLCLHNYFIKVNIYTDNPAFLEYISGKWAILSYPMTAKETLINIGKSVFFLTSTQLGGAFWFIGTLFLLSITYCYVDYLAKKALKTKDTFLIQTVVSFFFLGIGFLCHINGLAVKGMDKVFSYYVLFNGGVALKRYDIYEKYISWTSRGVILIISATILSLCKKLGVIVSLGDNYYTNPLILLIVSTAGWFFVYQIACFIGKARFFDKVMIYIGQNTMSIVILHFLCFKLINYIGVTIKKEPICLTAAFPVRYETGTWWILYLIAGIAIPIALNAGANFMVQKWESWQR